MIIFLYGEDSYRRLKNLTVIENAFKERHGSLSRDRFDLSFPEAYGPFKEFLGNRSMFDSAKLVILENAFQSENLKDLKGTLKSNLESEDSTVVVLSEKSPPADFKFLLKEPVKFQEFKALDAKAALSFIKKEASERGLQLSEKTVSYIAEAFQGDSWGIVTELDKLSLGGEMGKKEGGRSFYGLLNVLRGGKRLSDKIVSLERLISENKEDPARIFNSLAYFLGSAEEARRFADYDLAVKSGKLDYDEVLTDLALRS